MYIARGALYETMTLLEIFRRGKWISDESYSRIEMYGKGIGAMIKGLIDSISKSLQLNLVIKIELNFQVSP